MGLGGLRLIGDDKPHALESFGRDLQAFGIATDRSGSACEIASRKKGRASECPVRAIEAIFIH